MMARRCERVTQAVRLRTRSSCSQNSSSRTSGRARRNSRKRPAGMRRIRAAVLARTVAERFCRRGRPSPRPRPPGTSCAAPGARPRAARGSPRGCPRAGRPHGRRDRLRATGRPPRAGIPPPPEARDRPRADPSWVCGRSVAHGSGPACDERWLPGIQSHGRSGRFRENLGRPGGGGRRLRVGRAAGTDARASSTSRTRARSWSPESGLRTRGAPSGRPARRTSSSV